jgi:hypothetical protein
LLPTTLIDLIVSGKLLLLDLGFVTELQLAVWKKRARTGENSDLAGEIDEHFDHLKPFGAYHPHFASALAECVQDLSTERAVGNNKENDGDSLWYAFSEMYQHSRLKDSNQKKESI